MSCIALGVGSPQTHPVSARDQNYPAVYQPLRCFTHLVKCVEELSQSLLHGVRGGFAPHGGRDRRSQSLRHQTCQDIATSRVFFQLGGKVDDGGIETL
jgi:hypothetical protein